MANLYKDIRYVGGEISLTYTVKTKPSERKRIESPLDSIELFKEYYAEDMFFVESAYAILLDSAQRCVGVVACGNGDNACCWINQRKIMQAVVLSNSRAIILCHNHPSGHLRPSRDDDRLTKNLTDALRAIGATLIDHLVLSPEWDYFSYADNCKL